MIEILINYIKKLLLARRWRKQNKNNFTQAGLKFIYDFEKVKIGNFTYGTITVLNDGLKEKLLIGNFCSIAAEVVFVLNSEHYINHISTFPFKAIFQNISNEATSKGDIIIDDDVWIGFRATIMSGVHIGQGAVIAAGAVVTKDVPPYAIVGGVPAKVIKYRFTPEIIEQLLKIDFSKLDEQFILKNLNLFYEPLKNERQLEYLLKSYSKKKR